MTPSEPSYRPDPLQRAADRELYYEVVPVDDSTWMVVYQARERQSPVS